MERPGTASSLPLPRYNAVVPEDTPGCPFCTGPPAAWVAANDLAFAIRDRFPVSPGHTLVIPKRHVPTWFDATVAEQHALLALVDVVRRDLDGGDPKPDGYNIGVNVGVVAGQTVPHLHVHVIPRFAGDVPDPTGGVRFVIPHKANYLRPPPDRDDPLCDGDGPRALYHAVAPLPTKARRVDRRAPARPPGLDKPAARRILGACVSRASSLARMSAPGSLTAPRIVFHERREAHESPRLRGLLELPADLDGARAAA